MDILQAPRSTWVNRFRFGFREVPVLVWTARVNTDTFAWPRSGVYGRTRAQFRLKRDPRQAADRLVFLALSWICVV